VVKGADQLSAPFAFNFAAKAARMASVQMSAPRSVGKRVCVTSVDFCGACHRSWSDVMLAGTRGVINARFQPYRLEKSKCWRRGDARLTCSACHNPHEPLVQDTAAYDQKCLACHQMRIEKKSTVGERALVAKKGQGSRPAAGCPVSTKNCVTCHMPQVEIPSIHAPFTDHDIRIVRAGGSYPN